MKMVPTFFGQKPDPTSQDGLGSTKSDDKLLLPKSRLETIVLIIFRESLIFFKTVEYLKRINTRSEGRIHIYCTAYFPSRDLSRESYNDENLF